MLSLTRIVVEDKSNSEVFAVGRPIMESPVLPREMESERSRKPERRFPHLYEDITARIFSTHHSHLGTARWEIIDSWITALTSRSDIGR